MASLWDMMFGDSEAPESRADAIRKQVEDAERGYSLPEKKAEDPETTSMRLKKKRKSRLASKTLSSASRLST